MSCASADALWVDLWHVLTGVVRFVRVLQFLIARQGDVEKAAHFLRRHQEWEAGYEVADRAALVREVVALKAYVWPHRDRLGRPCIYVDAGRHIASDSTPESIKSFAVHLANQCVALLPPTQGVKGMVQPHQFTALFNLRDFGRAAFDVGAVQVIISTLDHHFPERLGALWLMHEPWLFWGLWKLIQPFLDARTVSKIHMLGGSPGDTLLDVWDAEKLPTAAGGTAEFSPDPDQLAANVAE